MPSSAAESPPSRGGSVFPLSLAVAAALSCWNAFGAPFAAITAAAALAMALWRQRTRSGPARLRLRAAAGVSAGALAVALVVLVATLRGAAGGALVPGGPTAASQDATRLLDDAERRTAERRAAARRELEQAPPDPAAPARSRGVH